MQSPFRSEEAAFRFVWMTAGFFLLIVAAAKLIGRWAGLGVFLAETALIATVITLKRSRAGPDEKEAMSDDD